jgi:hypothetical protein
VIDGEGSVIRIDGMMYPSMIASGIILRSSGEISRTLCAWLPGKRFATGEVRMCRNNHNGTVTVKVIFCNMKPTVPTLRESAMSQNFWNFDKLTS